MSNQSDVPKTWKGIAGKCHLVEIIKDGNQEIVVFKYYRSAKQRWEYKAQPKELTLYSIQIFKE